MGFHGISWDFMGHTLCLFKIAMEDGQFIDVFDDSPNLKMVILQSYVKSAEGVHISIYIYV